MNIEFKATAAQIHYLVTIVEPFGKLQYEYMQRQKRETKVINSILIEVADKFGDKLKTIARKQDIFSDKKKHKISMKFYQAHALSILLSGCKMNETDDYRKGLSEALLLIIDQKIT
jgi:hypothetical protein